MKIQKFDNEEDWLEARLGRVTGTRLKDLIVPKDFFWLEVKRDQEKVEEYLALEREVLAQIGGIEKELLF